METSEDSSNYVWVFKYADINGQVKYIFMDRWGPSKNGKEQKIIIYEKNEHISKSFVEGLKQQLKH